MFLVEEVLLIRPTSPFNTYADQSISGRGGMEQISTDFVDTYNPANNTGLHTEAGPTLVKQLLQLLTWRTVQFCRQKYSYT